MFHLDYWSCLLTVLSTLLVGKKLWYGLVVAAVNCVLVCIIGFNTGQFGFIPANLFCIGVYALSIRGWRKDDAAVVRASAPVPVPASADFRTDKPYLVLKRSALVDRARVGNSLLNAK